MDMLSYNILDNHLHMVVRTDPELVRTWSDEEVARRWLKLYPKKLQRARASGSTDQERERLGEEFIRNMAQDQRRVAVLRERLASVSWFMKMLKEPIARRGNQEDDYTGHFWEGRFRSYRLLDSAATLACSVYVDLNQWLHASTLIRRPRCRR